MLVVGEFMLRYIMINKAVRRELSRGVRIKFLKLLIFIPPLPHIPPIPHLNLGYKFRNV